MCDQDTPAEMERALARRGLSRRAFGIATAAILASCAKPGTGKASDGPLVESMVDIRTADGTADAFLVHPSGGPHPGIVMWPDIAGIRDAMKAMARNWAARGYAVLLVNPYYRSARAPVMQSLSEYFTPQGQARIRPMRDAITPAGAARDGAAFVAFLDGRPEADKARRIGTIGYCMGGPLAIRTAAAAPDRVGAVASMHGASLVTDGADSPHRLLKATKAQFLFAIGQNDDAKAPGDKTALKEAAAEAGRPAEIEVYPADHGWCALDAPVYDKEQANRANARALALFERAL